MSAWRRSAAAAVMVALGAVPAPAIAADEARVGITRDLPHVDVVHEGRRVRIERNADALNTVDPDYALTSRPCPPYCVQPMQLREGVETIGELEVLDYLRRASGGDRSVLVIDSREQEWIDRSGIIPGAVHLPWTELDQLRNDPERIATLLEERFGAVRSAGLWDFSAAKTLVLYCNGAWCGQSPTNIRQLSNLGYPANRLKWYRGGMQAWKMFGLTTVKPTRLR